MIFIFFHALNVLVIIVLLILYANDQYSKEGEYNYPGVKRSADFTVGYNISSLIGSIFALKHHIDIWLKIAPPNYVTDVSATWRKIVGIIVRYIIFGICVPVLSISSFGLHCGYATCFKIETPLYLNVLLSLVPIFSALAYIIPTLLVGMIYWVWTGEIINILWIKKLCSGSTYTPTNYVQLEIDQRVIDRELARKIYSSKNHICPKCKDPFSNSNVSIRDNDFYHSGCVDPN
ncbi:MAG: hypothetical protein Hyperionvirus5_4 [Hyperionvirus sp.]|uniref:Uncharacterized protein n=1 Tax=Hyperionvirus sp. TaxID=2487770 RepID=A0A3G5A7P4_9VIRU|nr:MAG: hypothetical protein Hyperionvirus5_4 [Hyperionvirus sp.]